ncbi:hypothetical protein F383_21729 [Gossypium arboreum]|uniref:Uncharacterized protein n=1 Tax=Gossypium arboreum TaxID=29729 RepID=A0A0B0NQE7_GOSAR|nr:hypothetical protein F383_21729 [Gossypium arboreum]
MRKCNLPYCHHHNSFHHNLP